MPCPCNICNTLQAGTNKLISEWLSQFIKVYMPQSTIAGHSLHWQTRRINKKQQIYFKNFVLIYLRFFPLFLLTNYYSQANLVPKLVKQMAKAWKAESGYLKSMVNISFATLPNCNITLSCSDGAAGSDSIGAPAAGCIADINWKFFTEAIVTRPRKLRHQHCSCSCHLGALFRSTNGLSFIWSPSSPSRVPTVISEKRELLKSIEWSIMEDLEKDMLRKESSSECGKRFSGWLGTLPPGSSADVGIEYMTQCIRRGPRVPRTFNSYLIWAML